MGMVPYMRLAKTLFPVAAVVALAVASPAASAAPIHDCHYGIGGAYHNLTTRVVPCSKAKGFHGLAFRMLNYVTPRIRWLRDGTFRWGEWSIRTHWYHDAAYPHIEGGNEQVDVRATASSGRVIRFQTAWD